MFELEPFPKKFLQQLREVSPRDKKKPNQWLWALFIGGSYDGAIMPFVDNDWGIVQLAAKCTESRTMEIKYFYPPLR